MDSEFIGMQPGPKAPEFTPEQKQDFHAAMIALGFTKVKRSGELCYQREPLEVQLVLERIGKFTMVSGLGKLIGVDHAPVRMSSNLHPSWLKWIIAALVEAIGEKLREEPQIFNISEEQREAVCKALASLE